MSGMLSSVDARTQLVGQNRLELLLFHLGGSQHFAINVFKVQEVMRLPPLTKIPDRHPVVRGVTRLASSNSNGHLKNRGQRGHYHCY